MIGHIPTNSSNKEMAVYMFTQTKKQKRHSAYPVEPCRNRLPSVEKKLINQGSSAFLK